MMTVSAIADDVLVRPGAKVASQPAVSVIMPSYNVARYIGEAIESAFTQTFTNYEIVVINDGSPDTPELEKVLAPYRERIVYAKQENKGVSAARNTGLRVARAPIIAQLDPDDAWLPDFLATQLDLMAREPSIDVLYANTVIFGNTPHAGVETMTLCPSEGEVTFEHLVSLKCTVLSCLTARREIFFKAGLYDESIRASEDFDMWLRILKVGGRIDYHRRVLARYRQRFDSLSADTIFMCKEILQVLDKAERTLDLTSSERESIAKGREHFQAMLSLNEGKKAILDGDNGLAIERLRDANSYYRSPKISLSLQLLNVAPGLLLRLYKARDRFFFRAKSKHGTS
jgi:glycosyltransferase involved in cell wall biosynthesis